MSDDTKLIIGMPAGSLADPKRGGNLIHLLEHAGFKTTGYEKGGPTQFSMLNYLFGWDGRPQEFAAQMAIQEMDVAIAGDDWVKERLLELEMEYDQKVELKKIMPLNRGAVKIVGICPPNDHEDMADYLKEIARDHSQIIAVSEMPYLALDWIRSHLKKANLLDKFPEFSVQKYKTPPKIKKGVVIYETWGKTEAKVKNGGAHLGLEITQTGSAIRNYGLKIIDTIMSSETGIWINPSMKKNDQKADLLKMFLLNLYGSINAENMVMVLFNVSKNDRDAVEEYLKENNLFADEPTINFGENFVEYSIQIDTTNKNTPLARVRYELAKRKAVSIDTLPISSAIPGIDVLNL